MADETQVTLNESVMPMKEGQVDVSNVDIVVDGKTMPNDTDTPESTTEEDINEIEAEYNSAAREQAEQESYIQP